MALGRNPYDFIVIGAGSAGCAVAAGLVEFEAGSVLLVEAGPRDSGPLVKTPMGLIWLMGGRRDWRFQSAPQAALGGRRLSIPRGRMLGGSSSINSMVWFRGRRDDFDGWNVEGWRWADVLAAFEAVEARLKPQRLADPNPLTEALHRLFGGNDTAPPTPEYESAGVFHFNIRRGRRWSAADAFLRPAQARGLRVITGQEVESLGVRQGKMRAVIFASGDELVAGRGIVLCAGSIGSPAILLRSGIGPPGNLKVVGIDLVARSDEVGQNLHDHPSAGIHYSGTHSGYGLTARQAPLWLSAPFRYLMTGKGPLGSPTVEGGGFFSARGDGGPPDIQTHFIPFMVGWQGTSIVRGSGYFADVCVCRPRSRGALRLTKQGLEIDLGILADSADLDLMTIAFKRLRELMLEAPFGSRHAPEAFPGAAVSSEKEIREYIRAQCGTAYHPVGTLRMGVGEAPVTPRLQVRGVDGLWVADASVMPAITSANTNAPAMMIGYRAAALMTNSAV